MNVDNNSHNSSQEGNIRKFNLALNDQEITSSVSSLSLASDLSKRSINLFNKWKTTKYVLVGNIAK